MAYLGKTPSQAVRQRYIYTASGSETSISGADDNGNTLTYTDGGYVDVYLNGVLLVAGTDYNTTTANTIGGLTALSASDVVEIVVYDVFSVFGGDVQGDLTISNGNFTVDTNTLYVDASANAVGIGTSSPSADLEIYKNNPELRLTDTDNNAYCKVLGVNGTLYIQADDSNIQANSNMIFEVDASEAMRIDSSGDLVYAGGNQAYSLRGEERVNSGATVTFFDLYTNDEGRGFYLVTASRNGGSVASRAVAIVANSSSSASYVYYVIDSNNLTISTSGSDITVTNSGGSDVDIHCSAIPLSLTKDF